MNYPKQNGIKANTTESSIRAISLLRRIGSIVTVLIIFIVLFSNCYHRIREKFIISDLKNIYSNGVSKLAVLEKEYKIITIGDQHQLTFKYSFEESSETYKNEYTLLGYLPQNTDTDALTKIFTVHYLKDDPDKNSLNIEGEIKRIETNIKESSTFWFVTKIIGTFIFGFILLGQILSLITEIRDIGKPIVIPEYLKK